MTRTSRLLACIAAIAASASSCLPADTRPTPSTIDVRFKGSPLLHDGLTTADGWKVSFDRVLITMGNPRLQDDPCTPYSEDGSDYSRIFDGSVLDPLKVGRLYGLGTCGFNWRLMNPSVDSIQSPGVTDDERITLITPGFDVYNSDPSKPTGVTLWFRGSASKDGVKKTFDWSFRSRRVSYHDCLPTWDGTPVKFSLPGDTQLIIDIELHPEALFQDRLEGRAANLRFGAYADADDKYGDTNGEVTLDELGKMTLENAGVTQDDLVVGDAGASGFEDSCKAAPNGCTFEYFVYAGLAPQIARLAGTVKCFSSLGGEHH